MESNSHLNQGQWKVSYGLGYITVYKSKVYTVYKANSILRLEFDKYFSCIVYVYQVI